MRRWESKEKITAPPAPPAPEKRDIFLCFSESESDSAFAVKLAKSLEALSYSLAISTQLEVAKLQANDPRNPVSPTPKKKLGATKSAADRLKFTFTGKAKDSSSSSSSSAGQEKPRWQDSLANSLVFAFVMTPESLQSQKCMEQIYFAYESNKLIIPCVLRDPWAQLNGTLRLMFQAIMWVDFTKNSFPMGVGLIGDQIERLRQGNQGAALPAHLTRFLANMTHELRNPMSAILGLSTVLGDDPQLTPHQNLLVETIKSSTESLLMTLGSVLDMTKLESCVLRLSPITFDLYEAITEAVRLYAFKAFQQNLELGILIDKTCPRFVHADRERLKQVLSNLVHNAIKFTYKGQILVVVSRRKTDPVSKAVDDQSKFLIDFTIIDSGVGMKKEDAMFLFKRFRQVNRTTSNTGTGLGLAICKSLVELMGGEIDGQSQGIHKGATFKFSVPVEPAHFIQGASLDKGLWAADDVKKAKPYEILIAYKNNVIAELIKTQLQCFGINDASTANKVEGLTRALDDFYSSPPSPAKLVLILDDNLMNLSYMSNDEALETIQTSPVMEKIRSFKDKNIHVVLCLDPAVYLSLEDVEKFGVNEVLYKPFVQVEFFNILRKAAGVPIQDNDTFKGQVFSETPLLSYDLKKKKILVVDDDEFLRRATALRLEQLGAVSDTAAGGSDAASLVSTNEYDLVIMDILMPGVDGYQATRLIREAEKAKKSTKPVAIFGITAGGMEGVQEKCFSCGMDGYLNKPLRMDDLQEYVGKMLFARDDTEEVVHVDKKFFHEFIRLFGTKAEMDAMVTEFQASGAQCLKDVKTHLNKSEVDYGAIRVAFDVFRDVARTVGAVQLFREVTKLERSAEHGGDVEEFTKGLDRIGAEIDEVAKEFKAAIAALH